MTSQFAFLIAFITGLLCTVMAMLRGVEKREGNEIRRPLAGLNLPVIGMTLVAFGVTGYLLSRYSNLGLGGRLLISLGAGTAAWMGMTTLLAKWALRAPLEDPHETQELLQGHIAVVVENIGAGTQGRIEYDLNDEHHSVRARSMDGRAIAKGTEVVIDRVEGDIAHVEPWSTVEPRL